MAENRVGIYGYETDVKIHQMRWDDSSFMYKVYLADKENNLLSM